MSDIKKMNIQDFKDHVIEQKDKDWVDFHSKGTIVLGSLIVDGFDWGRNDWTAYNISDEAMAVLRPRLNQKIEDRFFYREIGILPPAAFKRNLRSRLNDAVARQGFLYQSVFDGLDITLSEREELKRREVHSDYPAAQLAPKQMDYASYADEEQYEKTKRIGNIPLLLEFSNSTLEPDAQILEELEICFSQILSFNF